MDNFPIERIYVHFQVFAVVYMNVGVGVVWFGCKKHGEWKSCFDV